MTEIQYTEMSCVSLCINSKISEKVIKETILFIIASEIIKYLDVNLSEGITSVRMAIIKKTSNNKCWIWIKGTPMHY